MNIVKYFENRQLGTDTCEKIVGKMNLEKCAVVSDNFSELIKDIETGIIVQACESCVYSSEELRVFKTGLQAVRIFLSQAQNEYKMKQEIKKQEQEKKESPPMY